VIQPIPKEYNTFTYVINGEGLIGPVEKQKVAKTGQMVTFDKDGERVAISASAASTETKSELDLLLIGGIPLNEPVARYVPFVMNIKEEILQAIEDYRNGNIGEINS